MILNFATRRDTNGNRYYLVVDTERKAFAETSGKFYHEGEYIQITRRERRAIKEKAKADGYKAVDYI